MSRLGNKSVLKLFQITVVAVVVVVDLDEMHLATVAQLKGSFSNALELLAQTSGKSIFLH